MNILNPVWQQLNLVKVVSWLPPSLHQLHINWCGVGCWACILIIFPLSIIIRGKFWCWSLASAVIDSKFITSPGIAKNLIWFKKCLIHVIPKCWEIINLAALCALLGPMKASLHSLAPASPHFICFFPERISGIWEHICTQGCWHLIPACLLPSS